MICRYCRKPILQWSRWEKGGGGHNGLTGKSDLRYYHTDVPNSYCEISAGRNTVKDYSKVATPLQIKDYVR